MSAEIFHSLPKTFSPSQWETLYALTSTVLPPLSAEETELLLKSADSGKDLNAVKEFARNGATVDNASFRKCLEEVIEVSMNPQTRKTFGLVLNLLSSAVFCRAFIFTSPIPSLTLRQREELMEIWLGLKPGLVAFPPLRLFSRSILSLTRVLYIRASSQNPDTGLLKAMGWCPPVHNTNAEWFNFEFVECKEGDILDCDVVIVGSGPGGAIVADKLSREGKKVIVLEKGEWIPPTKFPLLENESCKMFENGMVLPTDDNSMSILAGSTFGGGGTVNWSACLQPQARVRTDWDEKSGTTFFTSSLFQDCIDTVWERLGVCLPKRHNHRNQVLIDGSRRLGYTCIEVPQNTNGQEHWDGDCGGGCSGGLRGTGWKAGPTNCTLPAAAQNGTRFIQRFYADSVLFDGKHATGVKGVWTTDTGSKVNVQINARRVVAACGALNTPLFLMRSGIKNAHLGKNLHLHPTSFITAVYPEKTNPQDGGILTTAVTEYENLDGQFYGVKLECISMTPAITMATTPWTAGVQQRLDIMAYDRSATFISLARDRDSGYVYPDPETGAVRIAYTPSNYDRKHVLLGVIALSKINYVQGALEIRGTLAGVKAYKRPVEEVGHRDWKKSPSFKAWIENLEKLLSSSDIPFTGVGSAHQMGTARIGGSPKIGVTDPTGRVWGKKNLYVADASLLPSACGVNPQIATMALAEWVSRNISSGFKEDGTPARL